MTTVSATALFVNFFSLLLKLQLGSFPSRGHERETPMSQGSADSCSLLGCRAAGTMED